MLTIFRTETVQENLKIQKTNGKVFSTKVDKTKDSHKSEQKMLKVATKTSYLSFQSDGCFFLFVSFLLASLFFFVGRFEDVSVDVHEKAADVT